MTAFAPEHTVRPMHPTTALRPVSIGNKALIVSFMLSIGALPGMSQADSTPVSISEISSLQSSPSTSLIPLALPDGQSRFHGGIGGIRNNDANSELGQQLSPIGAGILDLALDRGISGLEIGAQASLQSGTRSEIRSAFAHITAASRDMIGFRLDAGLRRHRVDSISLDGKTSIAEENAFAGGLAMPYQFRLGQGFFLTHGAGFNEAFSQSLIAWDLKPSNSVFTVGIPVAVEFSPKDRFSGQLRSGIRQLFGGGDTFSSYIPFGVDVKVALNGKTDLGLSADLPGSPNRKNFSNRQEYYLFEQRATLWTEARF